jgi:hypothetical protein
MDAYHKNSKTPHIEVIDVTKNSDTKETGLHFEVNDAFLDMIKKEKKIEVVSQELLSSYVQDLVTNCAGNKNGFNYNKIIKTNIDN